MSRKAIVLDDDRQVIMLATKVVSECGLDVEGFTEPKEAQSYLLRQKCDLVILDLVMPGMSGVDFAAWLREFSPFTRVVNITGLAPVRTLLGCWRQGVDSCVLKGKGFVPALKQAVSTSVSIVEQWEETIETARIHASKAASDAAPDATPDKTPVAPQD